MDAMLDLLGAEFACTWDEIEAKLGNSESGWGDYPHIDPHHLTSAKNRLDRDGLIEQTTAPTRGPRPVGTWSRTDLHLKTTAIDKAARRKRLLAGRYQSWAVAKSDKPEQIGRAGEDAAHASILSAAHASPGFQPLNANQTRREFSSLFGHDLKKLGSLDNAAHLHTVDQDYRPQQPIFIPIEVKNRRDWVYPVGSQLHQVLHKAAWLATQEPDMAIVPLLICRRSAYITITMAKDLGFFVIEAQTQPIAWRSEDNIRLFEEVRDELGYADLVTNTGPNDRVAQRLSNGLPKIVHSLAKKWRTFGPELLPYFEQLRKDTLDDKDRVRYGDALRQHAVKLGAEPGRSATTKW